MTGKPLRAPADPARVVKDYLATVIPALVGSPAPTFGMVLPDAWTPTDAPVVVVFDDTGPMTWPVTTSPTLRITTWAAGRDRSRLIAGRCLGVLLSHRIDGVATITQPTLLLEAVDDRNHGLMCSFTVSAQARTFAL